VTLFDNTRGVQASCVISAYSIDYNTDRYAIEAIGASTVDPPLPPPADPGTGEDEVSTFSIGAPSPANEGNSGATTFVFPVTRTAGLTGAAAVDWAVTGSGAHPASPSDFVGGAFPSGTLNFASGQSSANISVQVQGDTTSEFDEGFTVTLTNPRMIANLSTASASTTIVNDDTGSTTDANKMAFAGDSFTSTLTGTGEAPTPGKWAGNYAAHNPALTYYNFATGGTGISGANGLSSKLSAIIATNARWVATLYGQNDASGWQTTTPAAWTSEYFGYVGTLRSAGCQVAICTLIPHDISYYSGQANPATFVAGVNSWIASVNAILRGAVGTQFDRLIDFAADSILGDPAQTGDTTYRSDGLHPTGAGQARFTDISNGEIDAWLVAGHDVTPLQKFFADAVGAAAGATVTAAPIIFEHLGFGETVSVTVGNGGKHRKNGAGSFVTTALTITNNDSYEVQNTASATAGGTKDTPVNVNGVLFDTFTISTAGGVAAGFVATQASQIFSGGFGAGSSHSFNITHAGGRPCFVLSTNGARAFTTVTANGASCSPIVTISDGPTSFTLFTGPADIAAGTVTVAVTCDNPIGDLTIWYGELTGSDQLTPVGTASLGWLYRADGTQSATSSVSPSGNDIGVIFGHRDGGVALNSIGLTGGAVVKDYGDWFFGKFNGSGVPNYNTTGFGYSAMLVGVFS
jgi:lysophospholipase L1-like esterase